MIRLGMETVQRYRAFTEWTDTLGGLDDRIWFSPIAEGKAAVAEIIAHLHQWDHYLIHTIIPSIRVGAGMVFPDFDTFNQNAYAYARSGISKQGLLDEFKDTRIQLTELIRTEPEAAAQHVTVNGIAKCPHTGTPYSLLYIIYEFIEHDLHHQKQIQSVI